MARQYFQGCSLYWILSFIYLVAIFLPAIEGSNCGGILEGNSGRFSYSSKAVQGPTTCVWSIKVVSSQSLIQFKLDQLTEGSVLNLYQKFDPDQHVVDRISLTSDNISSVVDTTSQILVLVYIPSAENVEDKTVSFSWDESLAPIGRESAVDSGANYVSDSGGNNAGQCVWKRGKSGSAERQIWIINSIDGEQPQGDSSIDTDINVQFNSCSLPDPCWCSHFGLYEVNVGSGAVQEVDSICGRSVTFGANNLSPILVAVLTVNTTTTEVVTSNLDIVESVEISWNANGPGIVPTTTTETPEPIPFTCPEPDAILPCTCNVTAEWVFCQGSQVNQGHVNTLFSALRAVNGVPAGSELRLNDFYLWDTSMTQLDLTPLFFTRFNNSVFIYDNSLLETISGGPVDISLMDDNKDRAELRTIETPHLTIWRNFKLTDEGVKDLLNHFSTSMITFVLMQSSLVGQLNQEFLPGLSAFVNLESIGLQENYIRTISGGQFRTHSKLKHLNLAYNYISTMGPDALRFDDDGVGTNDQPLIWAEREAYLAGNQLRDESFVTNWGLETVQMRSSEIRIFGNFFEFISEEKFKPFLYANLSNRVLFNESPTTSSLICDERMKWLKDRTDELKTRVYGAYCSNDPGKTIFTTDLIP